MCKRALRVFEFLNPNPVLVYWDLQLFHSQEWSMSKFSRSLTTNITPHSKENLAFHSLLRWGMIATNNSHYPTPFKRLGECAFWAWEWMGPKISLYWPNIDKLLYGGILVRNYQLNKTLYRVDMSSPGAQPNDRLRKRSSIRVCCVPMATWCSILTLVPTNCK